jgi:hypothetical protein
LAMACFGGEWPVTTAVPAKAGALTRLILCGASRFRVMAAPRLPVGLRPRRQSHLRLPLRLRRHLRLRLERRRGLDQHRFHVRVHRAKGMESCLRI